MKTREQKRAGYIKTATSILRDKYANMRDPHGKDIDLELLANCVDIARASVSYIHIPAHAAKLYTGTHPIADYRAYVILHTCGKCKTFIAATPDDEVSELNCDDCGINRNTLERVLAVNILH